VGIFWNRRGSWTLTLPIRLVRRRISIRVSLSKSWVPDNCRRKKACCIVFRWWLIVRFWRH
jgi:hypothetical protein